MTSNVDIFMRRWHDLPYVDEETDLPILQNVAESQFYITPVCITSRYGTNCPPSQCFRCPTKNDAVTGKFPGPRVAVRKRRDKSGFFTVEILDREEYELAYLRWHGKKP